MESPEEPRVSTLTTITEEIEMKKLALAVLIVFVAVAFVAMGPTNSFAQQKQKIEKFGEDKRIQEWSKKKFETSNKTFNWRMSDPWGGLNFHDMAIHFCRHRARLLRRPPQHQGLPHRRHRPGHGNLRGDLQGHAGRLPLLARLLEGPQRGLRGLCLRALRARQRRLQHLVLRARRQGDVRRALRPLRHGALLLRQRRPGDRHALQQARHQARRISKA